MPSADSQRTFVHMSYAYGYGTATRIAMHGYLATARQAALERCRAASDGEPVCISGVSRCTAAG
jgi:hypothetical protein